MTTTKTCTKCKTEKPLSEFYKHRAIGVRHSLLSICKSCYDAGQAEHHHTSKAKPAQTDHLPNSKGCFMMPGPLTPSASAPAWTPLKASDLPQPVLRPGALDHTKYGSRQPDGSVKPYASPVCAPCYYQPRSTGSQGKERFY